MSASSIQRKSMGTAVRLVWRENNYDLFFKPHQIYSYIFQTFG